MKNTENKMVQKPAVGVSITLTAQEGKASECAEFLKIGAQMVQKTEPETLLWFAVQENKNTFKIIDFFANSEGMDKHFAGKTAGALKDKAVHLVEGGWDKGVLQRITKYQVLASVVNPSLFNHIK